MSYVDVHLNFGQMLVINDCEYYFFLNMQEIPCSALPLQEHYLWLLIKYYSEVFLFL